MQHENSLDHRGRAWEEAWLHAPLLAGVPGLVHGFSTRALADQQGPTAARGWLAAAQATELVLLRQVHGTEVVDPRQGDSAATPGARPTGDAWAGSPRGGRLLGILTADCLPVLLVHPASRRVAAVHSGWRGAVGGVVEAALECLDVPPVELVAALGPCIGSCCYQVGEEVAAAVGAASPHLAPWPGASDHHRFDLPGYVAAQLIGAGVPAERIDRVGLCTHCRADLFYSHRRAAEPERMVAFIGWADCGKQ